MLKYLSFLCPLYIFLCLFTTGFSTPVLKRPEHLPPIVKEYKTATIFGNMPYMQSTGVYLEEGDQYTILATGTIDMWPGGPPHIYKAEDGWLVMARYGNSYAFEPLNRGRNSDTIVAHDSGYLHVGYKEGSVDLMGNPDNPDSYKDDIGSILIDVIVWKEEDYVQIFEFFNEMYRRDPENRAVADALQYAKNNKEYEIARQQVVKKVDETKQMIEELKEQKAQTETGSQTDTSIPSAVPSTKTGVDQERIVKLETRLTELMAEVAQLDEMKKQLEEERKKTEQLSQALEETAGREKDLLNKLSVGVKAAPVIVVASPSDGDRTESRTIQLTGVAEDDTGISQININANNKVILPKNGRGLRVKKIELPKRYHFNERIALDKGLNTITIRSVDADGLAAEVVLRITRIERRRNVWALVVGINEYQNVRNLKYAVNDAQAFYNLLVKQNQIPQENVIILIDQQASLRNLRRALGTQLKKRAGKEDII